MSSNTSDDSERVAPASRKVRPQSKAVAGTVGPPLAGKKRKRDEEDAEIAASSADNVNEDPIVLSRAALRKAKKSSKTSTAKDGKGPVPSNAPDEKADHKQPSVRQNSIWVGNLSFKTTEDDLKTFFAPCGQMTRVNMPKKKTGGGDGHMRGQNMGFAYIDFSTSDGQAAAIKLSESPLDGRKLLIKNGKDYTGRPAATAEKAAADPEGNAALPAAHSMSKTAQKILRSQKHPPAPTLFVGNLGFETTEESIREMLEGHHRPTVKAGDDKAPEVEEEARARETAETHKKTKTESGGLGLRKVRMGTFEDTGVCKGWAFLDFHNPAQATAVLVNTRNHQLNGRTLVLEFASADAVRRGGGLIPRVDGVELRTERRKAGPRALKAIKRKEERVPPAFPVPQDSPSASKDRPTKRPRMDTSGRDHKPARSGVPGDRGALKRRLKPGAALALASQSNVQTGAIVRSEGKKITFS